ncbi:MAG: LysM peptidoglycan-binding domain-containing protein [Candidatus Omnitrophota bacterium]
MRYDNKKFGVKMLLGLTALLLLSGCFKRVEVVTRERLDRDLATGNRGTIHGTVPTTPSETPPTREYVEWNIEVPTYEVHVPLPQWRREWHDKELWGNQGYVVGGPSGKRGAKAPSSLEPPAEAPIARTPEKALYRRQEIPQAAVPVYTTYTVKQGDTLGKISTTVYGTSKNWKQIFEANRQILSDPNKLRPGQVLQVPQDLPKRQPSTENIK